MSARLSARQALVSKASPEWFTPGPIVQAACDLMGGIDLDPASCKHANQTIRAKLYYHKVDDGLAHAWYGRVFLNPPGGLVRPFWEKLVAHWRAGDVTEAIWIGYSLEQLQTLQRFKDTPLDFPLCFPRKRIAFESPHDGKKKSPTHANYIAYLNRSRDAGEATGDFVTIFSQFGACIA